jgi:hypothetical protein
MVVFDTKLQAANSIDCKSSSEMRPECDELRALWQ